MSPSNEFVYVQREQCGNGCSRPQRIPPGYAGTMRRSSRACSGALLETIEVPICPAGFPDY